jgi:hypothetical protein
MSKLFISYRRKSWSLAQQLAEKLRERLDAEIFVDIQGVDEVDFKQSLVKHIRECTALLLVVTEHTFTDRIHRDSDWVRFEIREALEHGKAIVLVREFACSLPPDLPDDISAIHKCQGIDFYPDYFPAAVERLAQFIVTIGAANPKEIVNSIDTLPPLEQPTQSNLYRRATLDDALRSVESGDYDKSIFLLEALLAEGFRSRYVNVDDLLGKARKERLDKLFDSLRQSVSTEVRGLLENLTKIANATPHDTTPLDRFQALSLDLLLEGRTAQTIEIAGKFKDIALPAIAPSAIPAGFQAWLDWLLSVKAVIEEVVDKCLQKENQDNSQDLRPKLQLLGQYKQYRPAIATLITDQLESNIRFDEYEPSVYLTVTTLQQYFKSWQATSAAKRINQWCRLR